MREKMEAAAENNNSSITDSLRQALQDKIDSGDIELPFLPEVARETLAMTRDENSDAAALAKLIYRDQSLAAHLLQIANSAAYLGNKKIVSLQQAIARLGFRVISEITLTMIVKAQLFDVKGQESTLSMLWQHSLASGTWSREIARTLRHNVESAFLCGLLHTVGKPVVLQSLIDIAAEHGIDPDQQLLDTLMDEFHVQMGVLLATDWKLPEPVIESIAHYQNYREATSFAREAMIVHSANHLSTLLLDGIDIEPEVLVTYESFSELNLYPEDIATLAEKQQLVRETIEALSI